MKEWKRCLAAVLSFIIFITSANFTEAAGTYDKENGVWMSTEAEVLGDYYGLSEDELDVLYNGAINAGYRYIAYTPYENKEGSSRNLLAVDYVNQVVYAKSYTTGMYTWLPTTAVLSADGEVVETLNLTTGVTYYNGNEYNASQAFTYDGNKYTVTLTFELSVNITTETQERILQIPAILAQTADNVANHVYGARFHAGNLGDMTPALKQLLEVQFEKEEVVTTVVSLEEDQQPAVVDFGTDNTQLVTETVITYEPALDPVEDADVIAAIEALYTEYTTNSGLILYKASDNYRKGNGNVLEFADDYGATLQSNCTELYEHISTLKNSARLRNAISKLAQTDVELYGKLQYLQSTLSSLIGTVRKPGPVRVLKEADNWKFIDKDVKASIFKSSYSKEAYAALEDAAYALKDEDIKVPTVTTETIPAAQVSISMDISICRVTVTMSGEVMSGEVGSYERITMEPATETLVLLEGTTEAQVQDAIENSGLEKETLEKWNALDADYQISSAYYDRTESGLSGDLHNDISDYQINYKPKEYKVNTNFRGKETVGYGFKLVFPESTDEETSYDYIVETEDGVKASYNEGVTYKVTKSVEITQLQGAEKTEHRLYDFLVSDVQYSMSDEAKAILGSSAVDSPTLNIRVPDKNIVNDIVYADGVYSITADDYASGIYGMSWIPNAVYVMNGSELVETVMFTDGTAMWTNSDFTHVSVDYCLKIEKIKNVGIDVALDETEDVLYALNLPYELVESVTKENQLLTGSEGTSVKSLYTSMNSIKAFMGKGMLSLIGQSMKTTAGQDAVRRLQTSEKVIVKDSKGNRMGYGAWSASNDEELALYTYMNLCENANWSLAKYYQDKYYEKLSLQTGIVAECLAAIVEDPGFDELLEAYGQTAKRQKIVDLIPELRYLSQNLSGPHKALKVNDSDFASLIELLLTMEGEVEKVDASNGIYAYSSVRKNGEKSGSISVSVKVGSKASRTKEVDYTLVDGVHTVTAEDEAAVYAYIAELEAAMKLTEDEKQYYELITTAIPQEGNTVGKNVTVSLVYTPKEYTVSFTGMKEAYTASFKYNSDYVIELPAYSNKTNDMNYYLYVIDGEEIRVNNASVGYFAFSKEDLTELFVDQHYKAQVVIKQTYSQWDVKPVVIEDGNVIRDSYLDFANKLLYLEVNPWGIDEEAFAENIVFENGLGEEKDYRIFNYNRASYTYIATGAVVEVYHENEDGEAVATEYSVILMGDVNKDGKVTLDDLKMLRDNYLGTATGDGRILDTATKLAADMNGNGKAFDSNDALLMSKKYNYWIPVDEVEYKSVLE